jgi:hypothetical protein
MYQRCSQTLAQLDDGSTLSFTQEDVDAGKTLLPSNPPALDMADNMVDLSHLHEPAGTPLRMVMPSCHG